MRSIGIIGAGLAGVTLARTLRHRGYDGALHLVGDEPELPYDRPPLSKDYLIGTNKPSDIWLHEPTFYEDNAIDLRTGSTVDHIAIGEGAIRLSDGESIAVDQLVLATGGRPRRLSLSGSELAGVSYLRSIADANSLRERLIDAASVVVVGGGFIGSEIAATARIMGKQVTIVEQAPRLLPRVLPADISDVLEEIHRDHGVRVLCRRHIQRFGGDTHVQFVELSGGLHIEADLVVIGIGMEPNDELASSAGLTCTDGIHVNPFGITSIPQVAAIGDVARRFDPNSGRSVRSEHWLSAQNQALRLADALLGAIPDTTETPWAWSHQYDHDIQVAGDCVDAEASIIRGNRDSKNFCALYLRNGKVVGAFGLNAGRDTRGAMRLIESGAQPTIEELQDAGMDLRKMATGRST